MIKKNDVLKSKNGDKKLDIQIIDIRDEYFYFKFLKEAMVYCLTLSELERDYVIPKSVWEPKVGEKYWIIDEDGDVDDQINYSQVVTDRQKNFLGVYQTKELAEQALAEIKEKIKK